MPSNDFIIRATRLVEVTSKGCVVCGSPLKTQIKNELIYETYSYINSFLVRTACQSCDWNNQWTRFYSELNSIDELIRPIEWGEGIVKGQPIPPPKPKRSKWRSF